MPDVSSRHCCLRLHEHDRRLVAVLGLAADPADRLVQQHRHALRLLEARLRVDRDVLAGQHARAEFGDDPRRRRAPSLSGSTRRPRAARRCRARSCAWTAAGCRLAGRRRRAAGALRHGAARSAAGAVERCARHGGAPAAAAAAGRGRGEAQRVLRARAGAPNARAVRASRAAPRPLAAVAARSACARPVPRRVSAAADGAPARTGVRAPAGGGGRFLSFRVAMVSG